MYRPTKPNVEQ